jgi:hypothetical protein
MKIKSTATYRELEKITGVELIDRTHLDENEWLDEYVEIEFIYNTVKILDGGECPVYELSPEPTKPQGFQTRR